MNSEQVGGVLRAVFAGLAGFVAAKGWIPADAYGAPARSVSRISPGAIPCTPKRKSIR